MTGWAAGDEGTLIFFDEHLELNAEEIPELVMLFVSVSHCVAD